MELTVEPDGLEVAPIARVQRSRLAFAVAVTVAALPVIVLDNLPATAEANEASVEVASSAAEGSSSSDGFPTSTTAPASTTTEAPTTTAAPATTTSEAPATTAGAVVQSLRAPAPTAPPTTAPPATSPPTTAGSSGYADPNDPATWERLAQCESGGNWAMNSGNGYYGGLQFSLATWRDVGGSGYPHQNTKAEQIRRGQILQARAGWDQWPHCARQLGYY